MAYLTYENHWGKGHSKIRTFGFFGTPYSTTQLLFPQKRLPPCLHLSPQVFIWGPSRTSWRKLRKYSLELKRGLLWSYFFCELYFGGNHRELDACPVNQEERLSDGKLTNELKCCDNCIVYVSPKRFTLSLNEIQSDQVIFLKSLKSILTSASKIY